MKFGIQELADAVNAWCAEHKVVPLNGRAGDQITIRNIRYYQSLGLVDRPIDASGEGFRMKHRLQLQAVRLLQSRGLPLNRIHSLLYGRTENELREVERRGLEEMNAIPEALPASVDWKVVPLAGDCLLLLGNGRTLTPEQRARIAEILDPRHSGNGGTSDTNAGRTH